MQFNVFLLQPHAIYVCACRKLAAENLKERKMRDSERKQKEVHSLQLHPCVPSDEDTTVWHHHCAP